MENLNQLLAKMPWNKRMEVLRVTRGWSQDAAASECGTSQKNYWLWEKGRTYPRYNNRRCIALAFGVRVEDIIASRNKKPLTG